ncbi:MAG TPA: NAD(P)/FAD-dependent oxidoreductase [Candidatus Limnocylindria bacterium]|nr:NAD(P)/FAD-dependent oxidoreductase [Candidatus Limnocylindria bacterium]
MTKIVIIGAGYGGLLAALGLSARGGSAFGGEKNRKDISITLIDKHDYQLFATNLYEVATADEEMTSMKQLKKSIAVPVKDIFKGKKVEFLKAEVTEINQQQKTVSMHLQKIEYDYLIVATGSQSDFFGIEGAEKFALPLKNLKDAFFIRNQIEFAVQQHRLDVNKKNLRIIVAGGGYTGVEFAGELPHFLDIVAWKNNYPRQKIEVTVVEAQNSLIPGLSERMSRDALMRLQDLMVRVQLSSFISKIDRNFLELTTGEKMEYDVLVWTTGVKAATLPFVQEMNKDKKGRVIVNEFLQVADHQEIFLAGDSGSINNIDGRPAPPTAQDAIAHGKYIAYALPLIINNIKPKPYQGKKHGFIVSIGGKWAILNYAGFYFTGWPAYFIRQMANMRYFASVVGWWKAFRLAVFDSEMYSRND